jgi:hypothetical protein
MTPLVVVGILAGSLGLTGVTGWLLGLFSSQAKWHGDRPAWSHRQPVSETPRSSWPWRALLWRGLEAFAVTSYPTALCAATAKSDRLAWESSQLVLATTEDSTLLLDLLVHHADLPVDQAWSPAVPVTFRVRLPDVPNRPDVGKTLRSWLDTQSSVEVSVDKEHGASLVHLTSAGTHITLPLEVA